RRDRGDSFFQRRIAYSIAQAKGEIISEKLVEIERERALPVIEILMNAGRDIQQDWAKSVERADRARPARIEQLAHQAQISASGKLLVPGQAKCFEPRSRHKPSDRFRNDAAKCLIKSRDFGRLQ